MGDSRRRRPRVPGLATLLTSYRKLNRAKFEVLMEIEEALPLSLFTREQELYHRYRRRALSYLETLIPGCFILLYIAMLVVAIVARNA